MLEAKDRWYKATFFRKGSSSRVTFYVTGKALQENDLPCLGKGWKHIGTSRHHSIQTPSNNWWFGVRRLERLFT